MNLFQSLEKKIYAPLWIWFLFAYINLYKRCSKLKSGVLCSGPVVSRPHPDQASQIIRENYKMIRENAKKIDKSFEEIAVLKLQIVELEKIIEKTIHRRKTNGFYDE